MISKEVLVYKSILTPLDGSKRAERILIHVEKLAHCFEAKVIFLQVVNYPDRLGHDETEILLYRQNMEKKLKQTKNYLTGLKGEFREKGIAAETRVVSGSIVREIIDCAEREGVDLMAMTSHGRGGLTRAFYGSVAAGVLNRIDRPLLIVRSRGDNKAKILDY